MHPKVKFTVVKVFTPMDILGHEITSNSGYKIPPCPIFKEGQEIVAENSFTKPDGFCGWAWRDLSVRLTKFDVIEDMDWPEKNVTYVACGDGLRPVIFKIEKLS